ncbi:MAG: sensor histidine kinase [Caldilineaceae bacterium]|nr:sensor histidine kinase [Caldilineaceae bacterium]
MSSMKRFSLNSLRSQLLLWIILPLLVVLLTFALTGVQGHGQAMHEMVQTRADGLARAAAALVAMRVDRSQNELLRLSSLPALHEDVLDPGMVIGTLERELAEFPGGLGLYQDGRLQIAAGDVSRLGDSSALRSAFEITSASQSAVTTLLDGDDWYLLYAAAVPQSNAEGQRVLLGGLPLKALMLPDLISSLGLDTPSKLTLLNADGQTLLSLQQGSDADQMSGENSVSSAAVIEGIGWQVHLSEGWTEWIPPVFRFGNMLLLVVLAAAALSILSAYFGVRQIVQPLEQLNRAVNVLGEGNFEAVQKQVAGVQEIEELQQALSHMATQLQRYQQELQSYIDAMTMAQEEERKRLARELHDETVQALIALNQQVEMVEHRLEDDPPQAVERLRTLRPLISGAISGIRRQIQDLRPLYLEDLGFVSALEMLVQQAAARHDIVGDFEVIGDPGVVLPPALEISGYRIVQEALKNVAGHAQATWVHVELIFEDEAVVVRIEDDGIGFDAHTRLHDLAQDGHYGLLGMNERARLHGGEIHVESTPGQGTIVMARLKVEV